MNNFGHESMDPHHHIDGSQVNFVVPPHEERQVRINEGDFNVVLYPEPKSAQRPSRLGKHTLILSGETTEVPVSHSLGVINPKKHL